MIHDIRDGRRALVSTSRVGLGPQAAMYLAVGPWKAEALESENDVKGFVDAARIDRAKLLRYNALDCVYTARIRTRQLREFKEDPLDADRRKHLYTQQLRLARLGSEMALRGFPVDERERRRLSKELLAIAQDRARTLAKLLRPYGKVDVFHPDQRDGKKGHIKISLAGGMNDRDLQALIYRERVKPGIETFNLEVPLTDVCWTDGGQPAVNKDALLFLFALDNTPDELRTIIRAVWQLDAPLKARSTFVESSSMLQSIGADGFMHAAINTCGTETGRWSCSDPNLFNLPEKKEEDAGSLSGDLPNIRSMYCAPRGYALVHRDMKAFEVEVLQHYTGDAALRTALDGGDVHSFRARLFMNMPADTVIPKGMRRQFKVVGLACQYHAGLDAVFMQVLRQIQDARYDEIKEIHARFPEVHTGIANHWASSLATAEQLGYNETAIMRRRRYYPPGDRIKDTETSNYAIQGTAADIMNCAFVGATESQFKNSLAYKIAKYFPKAWIAMHVYDSVDILCPKRDAKALDTLLADSMAGPWTVAGSARIYASDAKVGQRWSDV